MSSIIQAAGNGASSDDATERVGRREELYAAISIRRSAEAALGVAGKVRMTMMTFSSGRAAFNEV